MITIIPYQTNWPGEFQSLAFPIRAVLGDLAVRIDHIGSTSVPGLPAKDIIDIQVSVYSLEPAIEAGLVSLGFERRLTITQDHIPPGAPDDPSLWSKWYFKPPETLRPMHLHVRVFGRPNQRYPLLFRDFLRANPPAAQAYAQVKYSLAHYHADDVGAYYAVKDPVCDIIMQGAEFWADMTNWQFSSSDA